jgi:hypothetical protein
MPVIWPLIRLVQWRNDLFLRSHAPRAMILHVIWLLAPLMLTLSAASPPGTLGATAAVTAVFGILIVSLPAVPITAYRLSRAAARAHSL